jgi:hypothetical protein
VSAGGPYTIREGQDLTLAATALGADMGLVTGYSWDINGDGTFGDAVGANPTVTWATLQGLPGTLIRDDGTFDVTVRVTYQGNRQVESAPTTLTVTNAAPTLTLNPVAAINEHGVATLRGTITDPSAADTFTLDINWGDPLSPGNMETIDLSAPLPAHVTWDANSRQFTVTHQYLDDNPTFTSQDRYTINATVTDDDSGFGADVETVLVRNVAPIVNLDPVMMINENGVATLTGSIADAGRLDTFTLEVNWGDPLSPDNVQTFNFAANAAGSQTFRLTHRYLDDTPTATSQDTYTINVGVRDDDSGVGSNSETVLVNNLAPQLLNLSATTIDENGITRLTGNIVDAGSLDTFTLDVVWGDGAMESFDLAAGTTDFLATHQYLDDNPSGTPFDHFPIVVHSRERIRNPDRQDCGHWDAGQLHPEHQLGRLALAAKYRDHRPVESPEPRNF